MFRLTITIFAIGISLCLQLTQGYYTVATTNYVIRFYDSEYTWNGAKNLCRNIGIGWNLVQLDESEVSSQVYPRIGRYSAESYWIGLTDESVENTWKWLDGTSAYSLRWRNGEPNNGRDFFGNEANEDYVVIYKSDGKLNDKKSSEEAGVICAIKTTIKVVRWSIYTLTFFRLHSNNGLKWSVNPVQAQAECRKRSSRLVVLNTDTRNMITQNVQFRYEKYWTSDESSRCISVQKSSNSLIESNEGCGTGRYPFICEKSTLNKITLSTSAVVYAATVRSSTCTGNGYPIPSVSWLRNGQISSSSSQTVYQRKSEGKSILHMHRATLLDEGSYTCAAHQIGMVRRKIKVMVPSRPTIVSIKSTPCNSSLVITWKPHERASGLTHKITFQNLANNRIDKEMFIKTFSVNEAIVDGLNSSRNYRVKVTPCPSFCNTSYTAVSYTRTEGTPGPVSHPRVMIYNDICNVTWSWPIRNIESNITGFKIIVSSYIAKRPFGIPPKLSTTYEYISNSPNLSFVIPRISNRKHAVVIQAETCAGYGDSELALGECITDTDAPDYIEPPSTTSNSVSKNGNLNIRLKIPNEDNGPISCIFVVVRVTTTTNVSALHFDVEHMKEIGFSNSTPDAEYIASAINRTRLERDSSEYSLTLGIESTTTCYFNLEYQNRSRNGTNETSIQTTLPLIGNNKRLRRDKSYIVHVVTSTVTRNHNILFKASNGTIIESKYEGLKNSAKTNQGGEFDLSEPTSNIYHAYEKIVEPVDAQNNSYEKLDSNPAQNEYHSYQKIEDPVESSSHSYEKMIYSDMKSKS